MQNDLFRLETWAKTWQMSFNPNKCTVMEFRSGNKVDNLEAKYIFCGKQLEAVQSTKYLGILLQEDLNWDKHIDKQTKKGYQVLGMIKRALHEAPSEIRLLAYQTLCRPLLEYASEIWDPYKKKDIHQLEMVQNRAVRFISKLKGRDSVTKAREVLSLETLERRINQARIRPLSKILDPNATNDALVKSFPTLTNSPQHQHVTREITNSIPQTQSVVTNKYLYSFVPRTIRGLRGGEGSSGGSL